MWPDPRILDLFGIEHPILLAPMAGAGTSALAVAVAEAGGLGSLACAMLSAEQSKADLALVREGTQRPIHLNFFAHTPPKPDPFQQQRWLDRLQPYYQELGLDPTFRMPSAQRKPFDEAACDQVEAARPAVVSFHFGLPEQDLLDRVKATGAKVMGCATTVAEAVWLAERGCDAVIAQGYEAGGHRGLFLTDDLGSQVGTMALVPQVVDAVSIPVVAAGGIADGRGVAAALTLGAAAVQIGTAYLFCPEARIAAAHRAALKAVRDDGTRVTNLFSGRPARGLVNRLMRDIGPVSPEVPAFPLASGALAPLRSMAEAKGLGDFSPLWAGQAAGLGREIGAGELTQMLVRDALARLPKPTSQV